MAEIIGELLSIVDGRWKITPCMVEMTMKSWMVLINVAVIREIESMESMKSEGRSSSKDDYENCL